MDSPHPSVPPVDFAAVDRETLSPIVKWLLHDQTSEVVEWRSEPVRWISIMASDLRRFHGTATTGTEGSRAEHAWSLIVKVFHPPPAGAPANLPTSWDYWKREVVAYESGVLAALPGDLTTPRHVVDERPDGSFWLWLEEIATSQQRWTLDLHRRTARVLGRFNGAYVTGSPLPEVDGLGIGGLESWVSEPLDLDAVIRSRGIHRRALRDPDRVVRLAREQRMLLSVLERIPQAFVHRDAWSANILWRRGTDGLEAPVAIDWAMCGIGAIGEDAAGCVGGSLMQFVVEPEQASTLELAVLGGYLDGLGDVGWHGDVALARFGYLATLALRFGLALGWWAGILAEPSWREWLEAKFARPVSEIAAGWGTIMAFLLDRGDEAIAMLPSL